MDDLYFKGKAERLIYLLVESDGALRMKGLGVTKLHYSCKNTATRWKDAIESIIHPSTCPHLKASEAMKKLNEMYENMVDWEE
jgi:hypothetical protein